MLIRCGHTLELGSAQDPPGPRAPGPPARAPPRMIAAIVLFEKRTPQKNTDRVDCPRVRICLYSLRINLRPYLWLSSNRGCCVLHALVTGRRFSPEIISTIAFIKWQCLYFPPLFDMRRLEFHCK